MPNVIDITPLRALAKRASGRISDQTVAKRFERIAGDHLLQDPRAFRPARQSDIDKAPAWAREAAARGEELSVYRSNSALAARLHTVARRVEDACRVAGAVPAQRPDDTIAIAEAREFIAKFGRLNFDAAARKALVFARIVECWRERDETMRVCDAQSIVLLGGRIWHRISSVTELRTVGNEFRNCLGRSARSAGYGAQLAQGRAQFWVLRDVAGNGLMVAMAPAPLATHFLEVKGPLNTPIRGDDADLLQLGVAIGVRPRSPEPPPPAPNRALASLLAVAMQPCRCSLCDPRAARPFRLRRSVGAP